jgi:hypothetical protein
MIMNTNVDRARERFIELLRAGVIKYDARSGDVRLTLKSVKQHGYAEGEFHAYRFLDSQNLKKNIGGLYTVMHTFLYKIQAAPASPNEFRDLALDGLFTVTQPAAKALLARMAAEYATR